ncbi:ead/Ea22-like family protein [Cronobacter malonaticus]|uniref:ead/Ea22-like family protein n=1 Tax=Cronobacter malonaticus TaxID=413503 RepID=UPI00386B2B72
MTIDTAKLKAAAQEEIELRQVGDTSDNWQDLATPEAFLELIAGLEAAQRANAAQDDHINQQQDHIDKLEKGHEEAAKQIVSWRRLAKQNIAEREKDVAALDEARQRVAELVESHKKLRGAMAAIHNTIRMDGAYTPLSAIMNAAKRAHEESAAAADINLETGGE